MSQPAPYIPAVDFSADEANNLGGRSTVRTAMLDAELAAIETTLDQMLANLALIQRDDTELRDLIVKAHTLSADVRAMFAASGVNPRGAWQTVTAYAVKDIVSQGGVTYICAVAHTSGTFATDLAAGKWLSLMASDAANVSFTPASGIAAATVAAALAELGAQVGDGSSSIGFRNRIINGDMRIDQRNAGAAVTINTAAYTYTLDRWAAYGQAADGAFTVQRLSATPPGGFTHYLRATVTTADASIAAGQIYILRHAIEGNDVADLGFGAASAKAVTLSFWVRSSLTGTFSGALTNGGFTRGYPFTFTISNANTWEQKTVTIAGDTAGTWATDASAGFYLFLDLGCGSTGKGTAGAWTGTPVYGVTGAVNLIATNGATFDLTGVQLEAGSVATPFQRDPINVLIDKCQRYFEKTYDLNTAPGTITDVGKYRFVDPLAGGQVSFRFMTRKRGTPTCTSYSPATGVSGVYRDESSSADFSASPFFQGETGFVFALANHGAIDETCAFHWTASAEL